MPREKRNTWLGQNHLVIARANSDSKLFYDAHDYDGYLLHLRQMVRDRLIKLFAFCLREDEIRLVLSPKRAPLARTIQRLHGGHANRINRRHDRHGHLFAERFQSIVFYAHDLCEVVRSAHLWPVREGSVRRAENYRYSSHNAYLAADDQFADLIDVKEVLNQFASDLSIAKKAFVRFVEAAVLDNDDYGFIDQVDKAEMIPQAPAPKRRLSLLGLAKRVALLLNVSQVQLFSNSRRQDLVMARRLFATTAVTHTDRSVTEVAQFLRRDKAQVSRLVSQGMDLLEGDEAFKTLFESVKGRRKIE